MLALLILLTDNDPLVGLTYRPVDRSSQPNECVFR